MKKIDFNKYMPNGKTDLRCVSLKGELSNLGKHILLPFKVTLCGIPTVDCDPKLFPQIKNTAFDGLISEYKEEKWNITCKGCIKVATIVKKQKKSKN